MIQKSQENAYFDTFSAFLNPTIPRAGMNIWELKNAFFIKFYKFCGEKWGDMGNFM